MRGQFGSGSKHVPSGALDEIRVGKGSIWLKVKGCWVLVGVLDG